jgi:hypothetical protein
VPRCWHVSVPHHGFLTLANQPNVCRGVSSRLKLLDIERQLQSHILQLQWTDMWHVMTTNLSRPTAYKGKELFCSTHSQYQPSTVWRFVTTVVLSHRSYVGHCLLPEIRLMGCIGYRSTRCRPPSLFKWVIHNISRIEVLTAACMKMAVMCCYTL